MSGKENTLDKFFSPKSTLEKKKRRRSVGSPEELKYKKYSSPDRKMGGNKGGESSSSISMEQFRSILRSELTNFPNKEDFKKLETKIDEALQENLVMKKELDCMKKERKEIKNQINFLMNKVKSKNLIFRGVVSKTDEDHKKVLTEFCRAVLGVDTDFKIERVRKIGHKDLEYKLILAEFQTEVEAQTILTKTYKLKGTGMFIYKDLTATSRRRRYKLSQIRKEILKVDQHARITLREDCFYYKDHKFIWDEEEGLKAGRNEDGVTCLNTLLKYDFSKVVKNLLTDESVPIVNRNTNGNKS